MFDEALRAQVVGLFRSHGVDRDVSIAKQIDPTEVVFVVGTRAAARMREGSLTSALTELLGRKVWVVTGSAAWRDQIEPVPLD